MNNPLKTDNEGNILVSKGKIFFSFGLVVVIVVLVWNGAKRDSSYQSTLDWNTRQIAKIIATQERQGERLAEIELKANRLEWRVERLDNRVRGNAGVSPMNMVPTFTGPLNGEPPHDAE